MTTNPTAIECPDHKHIGTVIPFQANRCGYLDAHLDDAETTANEFAALTGHRYVWTTFEDDAEQVTVGVYRLDVLPGVVAKIPQIRIEGMSRYAR